ncbi:unnamed protein product [Commensalibacter communis]|uniref:hypothetical protein n=1 Tax=Commensalibacter communis TaxID=2972786 RepID=UPI0022FF6944|nr:hypothetical protein [Commensalibacter communis]CAI3954243.1 unnamed protein product [Commensalibacter communis]
MIKEITCILLLTIGLIGFNYQGFAQNSEAFTQTEQLAEKGDASAQFNLGLMYEMEMV